MKHTVTFTGMKIITPESRNEFNELASDWERRIEEILIEIHSTTDARGMLLSSHTHGVIDAVNGVINSLREVWDKEE